MSPRSLSSAISSCAPSRGSTSGISSLYIGSRVCADVVALLLVDLLPEESRHELIAAHADRAMDAPDREHEAVLPEGAKPGQRVLVVRVDQRAVDVEESSLDSHA